MIELIALAEPMPFWKGMIMMAVVMIGMLVLLAGVSYLCLRVLAGFVVTRDKAWEASGAKLGLTIEPGAIGMLKPLTGTRDGFAVRIEFYSLPRGESSADHYASAEVTLPQPAGFPFEIKKHEMWYQQVADYFDGGEIGIDFLDKAFNVTTSSRPSLLELLNAPIPDRESTNLLNNIMQAHKVFNRVRLTDHSVTIGVKADVGETEKVEQAIQRAVYIATRVQTALAKIETGG